jgi:GDP-4-dehydro-6-deoxy-D-mannose reductase
VPGTALVTGATGFAGSHLIEHLLAEKQVVAAWSNPNGASTPASSADVVWAAVDLLDRDAVFTAVASLRPSVVYHCAGAADVGGSWDDPAKSLRVNALGTHHLLDAIARAKIDTAVLVTSSALVYRPTTEPISEDGAIGPSGPYALSKLAQEMIAAAPGPFPVFLARPFNHAGPRQSPAYVTSSFARQIAEIEAGRTEPVLHVGNLESRRDITDVRDTVRAYALLAATGKSRRPYNVCSGRAHRIADLLDIMLAMARTPVRIVVDTARLRPSDNPVVVGNASRIADEVGWRATIPIEDTLRDLLDYWRRRVAASGA